MAVPPHIGTARCLEGATLPHPLSPPQVPEAMWQEVLPKVLKADLNSVLGSPEHLELFLLAQQKVPSKLEKLMGSVNLFSDENIPRCEGGGVGSSPGAKGPHLAHSQIGVWPGCVPASLDPQALVCAVDAT